MCVCVREGEVWVCECVKEGEGRCVGVKDRRSGM